MSQNFKFYAIVGNNGYGLYTDWYDLLSNVKLLQNEWHRGFQTEEEAYDWLVQQIGMRSRLNANGICDLDTLRNQRLVIIDSIQRPVQETFCRKPAEIKELNSLEELDKEISELGKQKIPKKKLSKKEQRKALIEQFECWLNILEGAPEE